MTIITTALLFVQDLPASPWNVAWSVQQEFYLYLAFPVLFANLTRIRHYVAVLVLCIAIRFGLSYNINPEILRDVSYGTIQGTVPLFVTGMLLAHLPRIPLPSWARLALLAGVIAVAWGFATFINAQGGFFTTSQTTTVWFMWFFYPEVSALIFGALLFAYDLAVDHTRVGRVGKLFANIGKISYSGYLLHVFMIDFTRHWLEMAGLSSISPYLQFAVFISLLLPLAWLSFNVIEKPFLKFRRRYVTGAEQEKPTVKIAA